MRRNERPARLIGLPLATGVALFALGLAPAAHALGTDRQQQMKIDADYSKIKQGTAAAAGVTYLRGNVRIVQGSMKASGAEATLYQHPSNAKDAQGNDISGDVKRVVIVGKQAHMEQQQDGGGLMTADADRIDYDNDTSIADLSGGVSVVQQGRGEFHGAHMTYNTNSGEMESGDNTPANRVHIIMQPKAKPAAQPAAKSAAPADAKPADTKSGQP
ncbi:MAG: lipopolysaccharide transport periplasmic protein LptA [Lysobacterales bacterium]